jgi:hypothetical protein
MPFNLPYLIYVYAYIYMHIPIYRRSPNEKRSGINSINDGIIDISGDNDPKEHSYSKEHSSSSIQIKPPSFSMSSFHTSTSTGKVIDRWIMLDTVSSTSYPLGLQAMIMVPKLSSS